MDSKDSNKPITHTSTKHFSYRHSNIPKPSLKILNERDSTHKLFTPSSRTAYLQSPIYTIQRPSPTYFTLNKNQNQSKSSKIEIKSDSNSISISSTNKNRNPSSSQNSTHNKNDRQKCITKHFIAQEMSKLAYAKYIKSPFAFIDRIESGELPITEFVYLNKIAAYDLQIVSCSEINQQNYYTLSFSGLTQFQSTSNISNDVIFTPLEQWQREYYLYSSMMNIRFFKLYRIWKCFRVWKKNILNAKIIKCNKVMYNHLFILNEHLRQPLFTIRELCCTLSNWQIFKIDVKSVLTLNEFIEQQNKHRIILVEKLQVICKKIKNEVLNACENRLHAHLVNNGFRHPKSKPEHHRFKLHGGKQMSDGILPSVKVSHAERAAIRTECRSLTKFIKMVDNFIQDAVMSLCRQKVKDLLKYMQNVQQKHSLKQVLEKEKQQTSAMTSARRKTVLNKSKKRSKDNMNSIFIANLKVDIKERSLTLYPIVNEFQEAVRTMIQESIAVILHPPNFVAHDSQLKIFTQGIDVGLNSEQMNDDNDDDDDEEHIIDLEQLLMNDMLFVNDMRAIQKCVLHSFDDSYVWINTLRKYLNVFLENAPQDFDYEMTNASKFDEYLTKYSTQMHLFSNMPVIQDISLLRIDCKSLKELFMPVPKERLKFMQSKLPEMSFKKCMELMQEISEMNENIMRTPSTVSQFVTFKSHLKLVHDRDEEIDYRFNEINDMFELINKHKIRLPKESTKSHGKLHQIRSTLITNVNISDSSMDDSTAKFQNFMKKAVPQLIKDIAGIRTLMEHEMLENYTEHENKLEDILEYISTSDDKLIAYEQLTKDYALYEHNLDMDITEYERLKDTRFDLDIKKELFVGLKEWNESTDQWKKCKLRELNLEDMQTFIKQYFKLVGKIARYLTSDNEVVDLLRSKVSDLKKMMPIIEHLGSPALHERHWIELKSLIQYDIYNDENFTLGTIFDKNLLQFEKDISNVAIAAAQEQSLIELLQKVKDMWIDCDLPLQAYKDYKNVYILGNLDDIVANLDESLVTVNTINSSRYVDCIREEVNEWNKRLVLFQETLDEWITMQKKWMYLETIFSGGDIAKQLPSETKLFEKIDKYWRDIMLHAYDMPDAIVCGTYSGRKETMITHNNSLDRIEKSLEEYLESKRQIFPRFYFLSNDELLEILADSKNPHKVQPHLRKCFDNIYSLDLMNDKSISIKAMISGEGERVQMGKNLKCGRKPVEEWLGHLESDMKKTLRKLMKVGISEYAVQERPDWIMNSIAQIVMSVSQIIWCQNTEQALMAQYIDDTHSNVVNNLQKWLEMNVKQISDLIVFVRGNLKKIDRKKIVAIVTTDVHNRDVIQNLIDRKCQSIYDFEWQKQLRFYWDMNSDHCIVRQISAILNYGYEYMGVSSRLVITPLTDRCWITVTGALHIKLGASPAGPAGTGKTESVKDLAKGLGIQCVVFNCSDQIDYKMMGKLFSGLAQTGSWTCLDEFNRIQIEVLSVVAQQLLCIRQALLQGLRHFNFEGQIIPLSEQFGVNITMNPGYAGRTPLPDNLKVLFRPVAMMIPDYGLIAEIMLFAEGFSEATLLSKKMVKLYKLSSEQLSQQDHYDFGMRAVKSVLVMAGSLKRAQPNVDESVVLIRAMRDSNIPKFLTADLPLFNAIVQDLFPSVNIPENDYGSLESTIRECIKKRNLQCEPGFITKIIQLFDTFDVRFGVMLVGPTGGGKTEIYRVLCDAMNKLRAENHEDQRFQTVHLHILNPKSISMGELYGEMNLLTQEWTDGLASSIMRSSIKDTSDDKHWVVFDGPVDTLWIESMNTVLDDNMTLCLANGERVKLKPELRMLFEVRDLAVASPATVSRCGMVYVPPDDLGVMPFIRSFFGKHAKGINTFDDNSGASNSANTCLIHDLSPESQEFCLTLFETHVPNVIKNIRKMGKSPIYAHDIALATGTCLMFQSLFSKEHKINLNTIPNEDILNLMIEKVFVFCVIWSIGGNIIGDGRQKFSDMIKNIFPKCGLPARESVFDVCIDCSTNTWIHWKDFVQPYEFNPSLAYTQILVPTLDTYRYSYITECMFDVNQSVFLTGDSGVGKTSIALDMVNRIRGEPKNVFPIILNFSAQTDAKSTQLSIEKKLQKRTKTMYGGPSGKKVLIFVDDINMPAKEIFGAQPPIELLRQMQDYHGFYDREKWFFKNIADTTIVCSAAPPGGGRSELTERFIRHFLLLCLPKPSVQVLTRIFSSILSGFLNCNGFRPDLQSVCKPMIQSTIDLYTDITNELLPIPAKSHYTFNLRDISKVFQGILMVNSSSVGSDTEKFIRLWIHESERCFHDRLIDDSDRDWFYDKILHYLTKNFKVHSIKFKKDVIFGENSCIIWGDFFKPGDKIYSELKTMPELNKILCGYLDDYNMETSNPMNLVFFNDAMKHLMRISRVLRQPRGNAMLVGVGGSGRQSLTRLACFIAEYSCISIELRRGYDYNMFREDLKELMMKAGAEGLQTVFLFNDTQIIDERFLEDINNILNSGEVPNLFTANEEFAKIEEYLHPFMKENEIPITPDNIWSTFVNRVRDNLHLVLCFSPVGDLFRQRCRMFPSLINCCTIDWYSKWPREALLSVSKRYLTDLDLPSDEVRDSVADMCVEVHNSVQLVSDQFFAELRRKVYTTPKSYLDMIKLYLVMIAEKREELGCRRKVLSTGLKKLEEANSVVTTLEEDLIKLQPKLVVKQKEAIELLAKIAIDQAEADKVKSKVSKEAEIVEKQATETRAVQEDAQTDLDKALPALEAAQTALKTLSKGDITEVKSMAKPPPGVVMVMEAVLILLKEKTDWANAKKVMAGSHFLKTLQVFDKDNIPPRTVAALKKKYISDNEFAIERMQKVSVAATALCKWVHAMVIYSEVAKTVEPKRKRVAEMNAELDQAMKVLKGKKDALQAIMDKVAQLKQECDETVQQKENLEFQSDQCKQRLQRAEKLTVGLADEQVRWKKQEACLRLEIEALVGDVFLSAAFVSYASPFTGVYRQQLTKQWLSTIQAKGIPCSDKYSFIKILGDPLEIRKWNTCGLPTDEVSIQNAIIVTRAERWPLMIDPQNQAKTWIRNLEKSNDLQIVKLDDPNLLRVLEICIRNGKPVLIEDIDEHLDPSIDPILNKTTFNQGGRTLIHLGDTDIDYDPNFRFYISTKLANPHYMPEISIKVTLINFTVTKDGLTEQLLGEVVKKERPEIDLKRQQLIEQMANDKQELKNIENTILRLLSESSGNILDDVVLIDTLESSKSTSNIINERVIESEKTEIEINDIRNEYHCVSKRGSIIFFVIADMALIDPMYQYSLAYFQKLFNSCIDKSESSEVLEERLEILMSNITLWIYMNICRGLFERHKLTFSFLICANILLDAKEISMDEWMHFFRGSSSSSDDNNSSPDLSIISSKTWAQIHSLEINFDTKFYGLTKNIHKKLFNSTSFWKQFLNDKEPHKLLFDTNHGQKRNRCRSLSQTYAEAANMTEFQKLMLLKTMRYEKVIFGIESFVCLKLGPQFVSLPPTKLSEVYKDTDKTTPIIFVLSTGADPQSVLIRFAKDMSFDDRLHNLSLGQGQGAKAEKLINLSIENGDWVCLQNCHLAKSWMPSLEKIVLKISDNPSVVNDSFRLWLTSMPCSYFPVPVLQMGVKITNEPPRGIRANLMRSYSSFDVATFESNTALMNESIAYSYRRLLFSLSFFHAVIQERRKFGSLGFNKRYEFNDSDLETSITILNMFLNELGNESSMDNKIIKSENNAQFSDIPWDALRYVIGQINYGGRVTDDWDRRCLMTILQNFYNTDILDEEKYSFAVDDSGRLIFQFSDGDLDYYRGFIQSLPTNDDPLIFGMHENANITYQTQETNKMIDTVLSIQPRDTTAKQSATDAEEENEEKQPKIKTSDDIIIDMAKDILSKLPQMLLMSEGEKTFSDSKQETDNGMMDSLTIFLCQEMEKFNKLLMVVQTSLKELQKAIVGEVVMSQTLDNIYNDLLNNKLPELWKNVSYPSLKPLNSWIIDLQMRVQFIREWLCNGKPCCYWMSAFFFTQGFITGIMQNHARKYKIPIDALSFEFKVLDEYSFENITQAPDDGVYVYGLFLDGCNWNDITNSLQDSNIGELYFKMPLIHMIPRHNFSSNVNDYSCPVYKTSVRAGVLSTTGQSTNYILPIEMPSMKPPQYWIKRGVALLTQLDD